MKQTRTFILAGLLVCVALAAEARLYRWVDDRGNVQYSDSPPPGGAKSISELDQRGMVRKTQEKALTTEEIAQQEVARQKELDMKRRDKALLMSFSRTEEIDFLRNRQIDAVLSRVQTTKLRRQTAEDKLKRLATQENALTKAKKKLPDALLADAENTRKEISVLEAEAKKQDAEIASINERAEADKKRFIELRGEGAR